jgi:hypothetical protein
MKKVPTLRRAVKVLTALVKTFTELRRAGFSDEEIGYSLGDASVPLHQAKLHLEAKVLPTQASVRYLYTSIPGDITWKRIRALGKKT